MEEQCRAKAREKGVTVVKDEFKKDRSIKLEWRISQLEGEKNQFEESLTREREAFQLELEKEREAAALKLKEVRAKSVAEAERLVFASATSRNNLQGKSTSSGIQRRRFWHLAKEIKRDLALNQLINELAELKERVASGSRHDAELAEYRIRALNEEISDMKCNIRALNGQLLKREIDLDTVRANLTVSEADFEKLSSSIVGKDLELRNSAQIRDSLIA
ncbi:hypothetical protein GIB67_017181, partial [Kingdonia uniflora]